MSEYKILNFIKNKNERPVLKYSIRGKTVGDTLRIAISKGIISMQEVLLAVKDARDETIDSIVDTIDESAEKVAKRLK